MLDLETLFMEPVEKKILFLSKLFQHLDGIALIPTVIELQKKGILNYIQIKNQCSLSNLAQRHQANEAYLNVALRLLCSQGIITQKINNREVFFYDKKIEKYLNSGVIQKYELVKELYNNPINYNQIITNKKSEKFSKSILFNVIKRYLTYKQENLTASKWDMHIEGALLSPIIVLLARNNFLNHLYQNETLQLGLHNNWDIIMQLFNKCELINDQNQITEYGSFIFKRASSYGVTVSYLATFQSINTLLYGDCNTLFNNNINEAETHVDRKMNVWGSGGAHNTYFKKIDKIIIDLFNLPIEEQPKGFIDIGCGNGKLIEHIFDLIYYQTNRGKVLQSHPLFIVGSDFNYKALEATSETIKKADIWAKTAFGDISDPDSLAKRLKTEHNIELHDLLNMRSFLDHNRIYTTPKYHNTQASLSTGAFCQRGKRILNHDVEQNLIEHFQKWAPYLKKYGLLIVELHSIDPLVSANNIGKTAITAYDATHGYSDQYIVEYDVFLQAALTAGLKPDPTHQYTFPSAEIPIVSINRLIKN